MRYVFGLFLLWLIMKDRFALYRDLIKSSPVPETTPNRETESK